MLLDAKDEFVLESDVVAAIRSEMEPRSFHLDLDVELLIHTELLSNLRVVIVYVVTRHVHRARAKVLSHLLCVECVV